ncbi:hypothetical protein HDU77_011357 [Chytriomyces hyalinus]|nr:hypothetical protein HDU77_011357 [Chytriomyces hyalinus]
MLQGTYHHILLWAREEANKTPGCSVEQVLAETNFGDDPLEKWQISTMVMPTNELIATPVTRLKTKRAKRNLITIKMPSQYTDDRHRRILDKMDDQAAYALLDAFEEVVWNDAQSLDSSQDYVVSAVLIPSQEWIDFTMLSHKIAPLAALPLKSKSAFLKCTGAFEAIAEMAFNLYKFRNLPDITKSAEMAQLLKIVQAEVKVFKKSAALT